MPPMPPVSHDVLSILHRWHDQQQPLVRALSAPMVEEVTMALVWRWYGAGMALDVAQAVVDQQEAALGELLSRMESLEQEWKGALDASRTEVADLTAKLQATTDRIHVLERKQFGRRSEKRKRPDARRAARTRRRSELSDEKERVARRMAAEAARQAKLDAMRTVTHTVSLPPTVDDGRRMPPVTSAERDSHPLSCCRGFLMSTSSSLLARLRLAH